MSAQELLTVALVTAGLLWLLAGGIGILRFPDFFTRLHPAGKADTFGATLVLLGLAIHAGLGLLAAKVLLVEAIIVLANPVAAHVLGRAALRSGLRPWAARGEEPR